MRPLTAVTLIVLGSCFAIMLSLAAVIVVVLILRDDYPRLQHEFAPLVQSLAIFVGMTAISVMSFYTMWKNHRARHVAQALLWAGLFLTGWFYWV